jgi:hypothetical integral membrane protein (TIGR02206 family)
MNKHLPLHLCDVAVFVGAIALASERRWLRSLTYFWAIGLSTQAFLTPAVTDGVAHIAYWLFWAQHAQVLGSAVYDVVALGYRPGGRDFLVACLGTLVYGLLVLPIDLLFDLNYGFVGRYVPEGDNVLRALPPWPERLAVMYGLTVALMLVLWLAWPLARSVRRFAR